MTDSFVFYRSFYEAIKNLDFEEQGKAYNAIMSYAFDGDESTADGVARVIFVMAKPQIDANAERRINGKRGGRPKKITDGSDNSENKKPMVLKTEEIKKPMVLQNVEIEKPNVNDNVNVNDNDNVNDNNNDIQEESAINIILASGKLYNVPIADIENFKKAYPNISVESELMKAASWCRSNPKNRKTEKGINRFINGWLSRCTSSPVYNGSNNRGFDSNEYLKELMEGNDE